MKIGLINELHGRPDGSAPPPTWNSFLARALAAESAGFDTFVYEDVLMYRSESATDGVWESTAISGALAAATTNIRFGQSVINSPYRSPSLTASTAETLNEISGGRYILGVGAGNSNDYAEFGFPSDKRFSRFAEWIAVVHELLRTRHSTFTGTFHQTNDAELVLHGPSEVPIVVAGGGPKMMRLVAQYASEWNWWTYDEQPDAAMARLAPIIEQLDDACDELGRDRSTLGRSLDVYSVVPPGFDIPEGSNPIAGTADEMAAALTSFESIGVGEVRCNVVPQTVEAIEAMAEVVDLVHAG